MEKIKCCICGKDMMGHSKVDGNPYCRKHYMQMYHHGHILERTIYDSNNYIEKDNYYIIESFDKYGNKNGDILIDKDDLNKVKPYKWHIRKSTGKLYAIATLPTGSRCGNKKIHLHKLIIASNSIIDHINGNGLDNRKCNLRVVTPQQNTFNMKKKKFIGVKKMPYKKVSYQAYIMKDYRHIYIGTYNTFEEAALARLIKEKELFGEYAGQKDLFYIINHPSPIEELKRVLSEGV